MREFLSVFATRRHENLEPFLDEEVVYRVDGFEPVVGRRAVLAYWRRMFESHEVVRMSLARQVRDGDLVLTAQRQFFSPTRWPPLLFDSMVLYEFHNDRVRVWWDCLSPEDIDESHTELWRRLRIARW